MNISSLLITTVLSSHIYHGVNTSQIKEAAWIYSSRWKWILALSYYLLHSLWVTRIQAFVYNLCSGSYDVVVSQLVNNGWECEASNKLKLGWYGQFDDCTANGWSIARNSCRFVSIICWLILHDDSFSGWRTLTVSNQIEENKTMHANKSVVKTRTLEALRKTGQLCTKNLLSKSSRHQLLHGCACKIISLEIVRYGRRKDSPI